ncbi:amino acid permease [Collibacillus ludicampi]|uniref:Amino acid permease n=1 Tax=Collibacillus ludicampi TaxID=2771369 RepID=A0AAV4LF24_9BACL|nr:APC family permease [Collibacillus ludicampi]GIM46424.1 amino acid permease [Collibacillus ludicampi]
MVHSHLLHPLLVIAAVVAILFAISNFSSLKRIIIGRPMRTKELYAKHNKLFWFMALLVLAADLYSSVAYGPEAGMTELASLGSDVKWLILPITIATVILLGILIASYIMGVMAYPNGGGAYTIAKENFDKPWVSLIASSALLVDYVLTVAVSVSAGVQAVASAYPVIAPHATTISVLCVIVILIVNLRGISESATVFAWPTLFFMICMGILILTGISDQFQHGFVQPSTPPFGVMPKGLTTLLILKAFSAACSSLTGIETISNSVPVFRDPATKNAVKAYIALGLITGATLLGYSYELYVKGISVNPQNTMLSQLAGVYFGHSIVYQIMIWSTFIVLILAANSTFTGFPQLAALVASDGFLPRALTVRGDRLGYSNGMLILTALASLLIIGFEARTEALIPLYSIGVFVSFTIAQIGLVRRWIRVKGSYWKVKMSMNAIGALTTISVLIVVASTKFTEGAWIVLIVLPAIIFGCLGIKRHYNQVANELRIDFETHKPSSHHILTIVLISGIHRVVLNTISFAQSLNTDVVAVYVGFNEQDIERMEQKWEDWGSPCRLITLKSEYRSLLGPITRFLKRMETKEGRPDHVHIIIPQFIPRKWWHYFLHNQSALLLRAWLLRNKDVVITTVPYHLQK